MSDDSAPAFTVTRAELAGMIRDAVHDALGMARPKLLDKQSLAQTLDCSAAHIDHLRKRGLPIVRVGQSVRFEPAEVIAWLRQQSSQNDSE